MKDGYRTVGVIVSFTIGALVVMFNAAAFLIGLPTQLFKRLRR